MIELRKFTKDDFKKLMSWITSVELMIQWCGKTFEYPLTDEQLGKYIEGEDKQPPIRKIFKAVDTISGVHVGNITLERINTENHSAAITCVIIGDASYRGKGICYLMTKKVVDIAFNELGLNLLTLNVFDFNEPALKCYIKAGFKEVNRIMKTYDGNEYVNLKMELKKNN